MSKNKKLELNQKRKKFFLKLSKLESEAGKLSLPKTKQSIDTSMRVMAYELRGQEEQRAKKKR